MIQLIKTETEHKSLSKTYNKKEQLAYSYYLAWEQSHSFVSQKKNRNNIRNNIKTTRRTNKGPHKSCLLAKCDQLSN